MASDSFPPDPAAPVAWARAPPNTSSAPSHAGLLATNGWQRRPRAPTRANVTAAVSATVQGEASMATDIRKAATRSAPLRQRARAPARVRRKGFAWLATLKLRAWHTHTHTLEPKRLRPRRSQHTACRPPSSRRPPRDPALRGRRTPRETACRSSQQIAAARAATPWPPSAARVLRGGVRAGVHQRAIK